MKQFIESAKYLFYIIFVVGAYLFFGFMTKDKIKTTVEKLLQENVDKSIEVVTISLNGLFLIDDHREGNAIISLDNRRSEIKFSTTGNGVWEEIYVSISGTERLKLAMQELFGE